jgi:hypothetical protein
MVEYQWWDGLGEEALLQHDNLLWEVALIFLGDVYLLQVSRR